MRFQAGYFLWFLFFLTVEILIAIFAHDQVIRPFVGDFFVVILIYCLVRAFTKLNVLQACIVVLVFAYLVEVSQHFNFATRLGLRPGDVGYIVLGNSFSWEDMFIYTIGIATVWVLERKRSRFS